MGTSSPNHQRLKRGILAFSLLSLWSLNSCKHRRGPSVPEEWDPAGLDVTITQLNAILPHTKSLRVLELFEDGYVMTDTLTFRLDPEKLTLDVERQFDPVPFSPEEPLVVQKNASWSAESRAQFLDRLAQASIRQVPRCNPYGAIDGGYGGRFLILVDGTGREFRFGANDADCAASDHDCSGPCVSVAVMNQAVADLSAVLPIPEKPETVFTCASDSPLPCGSSSLTIYGTWDGSTLRADIRRYLASRICDLAAHTVEPAREGHWVVRNSSRESIGTVRFNTQNHSVACLIR
ncbi:hypothetical protein [Oligoflexus tunisiensis]|uniref:hypothetical protein n=1 Tax=Oligoflexus tunisiensis TaxID=708132 RepID=UPI00114D07FA|nr:hypothetical protein [Oligoflexus tunisiensis]